MSHSTSQVQHQANDNSEDSSDTHLLGIEISALTPSHSFAWPRSYHETFENFIKENSLTKKDSTPPKKLKQYTGTILERFGWKDYQGIPAKDGVSVQSIIEQNIEAQLKRMLRQISTPSTRQSNRLAGRAPQNELEQRPQPQSTASLAQTTANLQSLNASIHTVPNTLEAFTGFTAAPFEPNENSFSEVEDPGSAEETTRDKTSRPRPRQCRSRSQEAPHNSGREFPSNASEHDHQDLRPEPLNISSRIKKKENTPLIHHNSNADVLHAQQSGSNGKTYVGLGTVQSGISPKSPRIEGQRREQYLQRSAPPPETFRHLPNTDHTQATQLPSDHLCSPSYQEDTAIAGMVGGDGSGHFDMVSLSSIEESNDGEQSRERERRDLPEKYQHNPNSDPFHCWHQERHEQQGNLERSRTSSRTQERQEQYGNFQPSRTSSRTQYKPKNGTPEQSKQTLPDYRTAHFRFPIDNSHSRPISATGSRYEQDQRPPSQSQYLSSPRPRHPYDSRVNDGKYSPSPQIPGQFPAAISLPPTPDRSPYHTSHYEQLTQNDNEPTNLNRPLPRRAHPFDIQLTDDRYGYGRYEEFENSRERRGGSIRGDGGGGTFDDLVSLTSIAVSSDGEGDQNRNDRNRTSMPRTFSLDRDRYTPVPSPMPRRERSFEGSREERNSYIEMNANSNMDTRQQEDHYRQEQHQEQERIYREQIVRAQREVERAFEGLRERVKERVKDILGVFRKEVRGIERERERWRERVTYL